MGTLGYVMHVPEEEKYLNNEAELRTMLVGLLAGRAAEELVFDTVTTGAANDIEKATNIARAMVTQYGMSQRFGLMGLATVESRYLDNRASLNCSDATAAHVDAEVVSILKDSYQMALDLLSSHRTLMEKLAEYLIEKETITGKEFMEIFRREKGLPEEAPGPKQKEGEEAVAQGSVGRKTASEVAVSPEPGADDGTIPAEPDIRTGEAAPEVAVSPEPGADDGTIPAEPDIRTGEAAPDIPRERGRFSGGVWQCSASGIRQL